MEVITLKEASEIAGIDAKSLYIAARKGRLKFHKKEGSNRIEVVKSDLAHYIEKKYDRTDSKFNGELKWDKKKGEYSISEAAEFLGVPANMVYYFVRRGKMAYTKKGCSYVIHIEEMLRVKRILIDK